MTYAPLIKEIGRGAKGAKPLTIDQSETLFGDMLDGRVPELELGAIVLSLRIKGESLDELLGFKRAMDARTAQVAVPDGPRCVVLPSYNGARRQPNLMPLLALLLAREGVPVLIQGRHDFDTRVSPFDLLAALDLPLSPDAAAAGAALTETRIAAIALDTLLPGLDRLLALRPRLGVRNSGHTLAKLLDPARGRSVRVVAVTHPEYLVRMDEFLRADGGHAMLMRGTEGEAYANPRRRPPLALYRDGALETLEGEGGGAPPKAEVPDVPEVAGNAALIRAMLAGTTPVPEPIRIQVDALKRLAGAA
ncbi:DNA-binding protein YbiB [Denitromonas iodatirespirans]|uniref:DNA-binding protein YbiB n=1 Tax=Denitromonas iodatirespirans TaxID=2795389 RepID=A0A944D6H0_DENI1|nr:DNA-binding protein YbiB [Denitromonas iodatirespirans]MBT0960885.1 DNA-binding protein YbiB [Denitromonas iodatirespirans]